MKLTVMLALAVALLKAVVPPFAMASAVPPAVPLVWSHAWKLIPLATVPFQLGLGTKRAYVLASAAKSSALLALGEPKLVQLPPPLVLYCQVPFVLSTAVTA